MLEGFVRVGCPECNREMYYPEDNYGAGMRPVCEDHDLPMEELEVEEPPSVYDLDTETLAKMYARMTLKELASEVQEPHAKVRREMDDRGIEIRNPGEKVPTSRRDSDTETTGVERSGGGQQ